MGPARSYVHGGNVQPPHHGRTFNELLLTLNMLALRLFLSKTQKTIFGHFTATGLSGVDELQDERRVSSAKSRGDFTQTTFQASLQSFTCSANSILQLHVRKCSTSISFSQFHVLSVYFRTTLQIHTLRR